MQLEKSVVAALKNIGMPSDVTVVLSDRDGVEPKAPYLLINIMSTNKIGMPRRKINHSPLDVTESVFQVKDFYLSLVFHATTSDPLQDWIQKFDTGITSDMYDWSFSQQGLGLVRTDTIIYQSQPVSGKAYRRAIVGIVLRSEVEEKYAVNAVESVEVNGNLSFGNMLYVYVAYSDLEILYRSVHPLHPYNNNTVAV